MATQLETLHQLQVLDTRLLEKQRFVDRYEADLTARKASIAAVSARIDGLAAARKDLVVQRALAERRVDDLQAALKTKRQRAQKARNEKEMRAGQDEVAAAQEEIKEAEGALLDLMAKVEELEASIEMAKAERAGRETEDHRHIAEASERISVLKVELEAERAAREVAAAAVEAGLRKKYDLLLQRRAGLAVVEVDGGGCCAGCHVQIPPQTLLEIRRTGALKVCPMCQRMLVIPAPPEEAPAE